MNTVPITTKLPSGVTASISYNNEDKKSYLNIGGNKVHVYEARGLLSYLFTYIGYVFQKHSHPSDWVEASLNLHGKKYVVLINKEDFEKSEEIKTAFRSALNNMYKTCQSDRNKAIELRNKLNLPLSIDDLFKDYSTKKLDKEPKNEDLKDDIKITYEAKDDKKIKEISIKVSHQHQNPGQYDYIKLSRENGDKWTFRNDKNSSIPTDFQEEEIITNSKGIVIEDKLRENYDLFHHLEDLVIHKTLEDGSSYIPVTWKLGRQIITYDDLEKFENWQSREYKKTPSFKQLKQLDSVARVSFTRADGRKKDMLVIKIKEESSKEESCIILGYLEKQWYLNNFKGNGKSEKITGLKKESQEQIWQSIKSLMNGDKIVEGDKTWKLA